MLRIQLSKPYVWKLGYFATEKKEKFAGNATNSIILAFCVQTWLFCDWKNQEQIYQI